jgi:hypothetical protein
MTRRDAHDRLRNELLKSSLYDDVPLTHFESVITRDDLAEDTADQQQLVLRVIRSLVADGLMEFAGWRDLDLDTAMDRVRSLFVDHYDLADGGRSRCG